MKQKKNNADSVIVWGTGSPRREFLNVDDLADACVFIMKKEFPGQEYENKPLFNIGTGKDISIKELAELIRTITGFKGDIVFDPSKPDGVPRKLLDVSKLNDLEWKAEINLENGIKQTCEWFKELSGIEMEFTGP